MFLVSGMHSLDKKLFPSHIVMYEEPINFNGIDRRDVAAFKGIAVIQTQKHLEYWKEHIFPGTSKANYGFLDRLQIDYSFVVEKLPKPVFAPVLFLLGRQGIRCWLPRPMANYRKLSPSFNCYS